MLIDLTGLAALSLVALIPAAPVQDHPPTPAAAAQDGAAQPIPDPATEEPAPAEPRLEEVAIETALGTIILALEVERAPITAANFLRYADERRFDGIVCYRAMRLDWGEQPNGLLQCGAQWDPERVLDPIPHEPTDETGVTHTAGAISMAMLEPGTANGDWSILLSPMKGLDADPDAQDPVRRHGYAAFGHVVSGMDVVEAIWNSPLDPDEGEGFLKGQMIAKPVEILTVRRVEDEDADTGS